MRTTMLVARWCWRKKEEEEEEDSCGPWQATVLLEGPVFCRRVGSKADSAIGRRAMTRFGSNLGSAFAAQDSFFGVSEIGYKTAGKQDWRNWARFRWQEAVVLVAWLPLEVQRYSRGRGAAAVSRKSWLAVPVEGSASAMDFFFFTCQVARLLPQLQHGSPQLPPKQARRKSGQCFGITPPA